MSKGKKKNNLKNHLQLILQNEINSFVHKAMQASMTHYRSIFKRYQQDGFFYSRFLKNPVIYVIFELSFVLLFSHLFSFLLSIASIISQACNFGTNEQKYKLLTDYVMTSTEVPKSGTEINSWWTRENCRQGHKPPQTYISFRKSFRTMIFYFKKPAHCI